MIKAYILLTINLGSTKQVLDDLKKLERNELTVIESISMVTGIYDVVIKVKVDTLEALYDLTYIHLSNIKGIEKLTTFVIEKEIIPEED